MRTNGIGKELLENWINGNSDERKTIEKTFYLLFDEKFEKYIEDYITKTTPPKE